MQVRIYRPAKTAMQSGRRKTKNWLIEFPPSDPLKPEPLMGWVSSEDTQKQIQLEFDSQENAIAYAMAKGYSYVLDKPEERTPKNKSYADNFRYNKPGTNN
ncbi:MAG: ETC complex I subunit [Dongiaceae bacterium]